MVGGALAIPTLSGLSPDLLLALGRRVHAAAGSSALGLFDAHQDETVSTIAELIIPETDTPGARAARVNEFIDLIVAEWYWPGEQLSFVTGLADVDARARAAFGADFVDGNEKQQMAILAQLAAEAAADETTLGPRFFQQIRWLTVYGYYTSEIGVREELEWVAIPGRYDACAGDRVAERTEFTDKPDLSRIHAVPDPFYSTSHSRLGAARQRIRFVNLPPEATIRIYSAGGVLVDVINHYDPTGGDEARWDVRNRSGQPVASGVYFYHVTTPDGKAHVGKFTILN